MSPVRIRIRVEGCLDAVLAGILAEAAGLKRTQYEIPMPRGGWRGALRGLERDIAAGIRSLAFIDIDRDVELAWNRVSGTLKRFQLELKQKPIPHINVILDDDTVSRVLLWGRPPDY